MILERNGNTYELPDRKTVQLCEIDVGNYFTYFNAICLQLSDESASSENGAYSILNIATGNVYVESGGVDVEPLHCDVKLSRVQFHEGKESGDVENMNRQQYIDWLIAEKGYSYNKAVNMADFMGVSE